MAKNEEVILTQEQNDYVEPAWYDGILDSWASIVFGLLLSIGMLLIHDGTNIGNTTIRNLGIVILINLAAIGVTRFVLYILREMR